MWFKNLAIYRLTEPFTLTPIELEEKLSQSVFRHCGQTEESTQGWAAPLGGNAQQLVHVTNGNFMITLQREEKVLPAAVVNELLQEKILEAEDKKGAKLSKKEKTELKDELIFELLPRAFAFSSKTYAYIDVKNGWIVVNSGSANKAENILSFLRKNLGSLAVVPINTIDRPSVIMTNWLTTNSLPSGLVIEDECELRSPEEEGGIIRCKKHDLFLPEIGNHLASGKEVSKLAVSLDDKLSFTIDNTLVVKRLKFLDLVQQQRSDTETNSEAESFDADFSIMSLEIAEFIPKLLGLFGG